MHPSFVLAFFPLFPIWDGQQCLKEETIERRFSRTFPVENQKRIQEKRLPFYTIPSRAGKKNLMQLSQPDNPSLPTLCSAHCKLPGEHARRQAAILRWGECGRVHACLHAGAGGPIYAAGCELLAAAMKPSESTCSPNRIEMTRAFPPIRRRSIIYPAQREHSLLQQTTIPRLKQKRRRAVRSPGLSRAGADGDRLSTPHRRRLSWAEIVPDGAAGGIKKWHQRRQRLPLRCLCFSLLPWADAFGSASPASVTVLRTG